MGFWQLGSKHLPITLRYASHLHTIVKTTCECGKFGSPFKGSCREATEG